LLEESPSLRPTVGAVIARQLPAVRGIVAETLADYGEIPRVPLEDIHYDSDAVLGRGFPAEPDSPG
jgi:hypothetical protein